ncbi:DnaJ C-terminal domain-containing protein [Rhizobium sp. 9140]|uniref:DnaJ C-terminal domain-containing protein n=1 Tax=Rhizobium sp. 9140 TaxID=1761900 RepID=UPI0007951AC5|nr:DnaJ C-terminal domain-containing protein [Rhizobium sp. 9140]CZT34434.1 DnaJ C terminal domain-containing protein [Rhizobium sp. 9140]
MKMSMQDPYAVLGVRRNAGPDEIKAAWRAVAKAVHPDQNREDPNATARFAEAGRAYEVLKDPQMRNRYDQARRNADLRRMEEMKRRANPSAPEQAVGPETAEEAVSRIFGTENGKPEAAQAASSKPAPRPAPSPKNDAPPADAKVADEAAPEHAAEAAPAGAPFGPGILARAAAPAAEIVSSLFRRILPTSPATGERAEDRLHEKHGERHAEKPAADRVPDLVCEAVATVEDLFKRRRVTATLPDGQVLKVALPAGTTDGSLIRLREQGYRQGSARGDALVSIRVARHEQFRVDGTDLRTTLSLSLHDAVLGCTTTVGTVTGHVPLVVPPWSGPDRPLRIPDQGLPTADGQRGALIIELSLTLSTRPDQKLMDLMRSQRDGLVL